MGKKLKVGKSRKDKFYKLSKEIGYRSRAAFKLIQLNQKYSFLQNSSVLLDLCCAPGGWLQVAAKTMAASSLIIGIDLVPIKPLPNVEFIQEDITTDKCYSLLKRFLKTCKLDCVLHDGAPNLGNNWLHDAHSQVRLSFYAFKLAVNFLAPGGWFITKLFRSKDYNSMIWLFQKFFRKVESTKPQASRNESAEIYVICQGFIHYDKIDAKFLDPKFIFQEVDDDSANPPPPPAKEGGETSKENAENVQKSVDPVDDIDGGKIGGGMDAREIGRLKFRLLNDADSMLISDVDFVISPSHKNILAKESTVREVLLTDPRVRAHPSTTPEIRELCADLKVLGKGDVRILTKWALKLQKALFPNPKKAVDPDKEPTLTEEELVEKMVETARKEADRDLKLKRRKVAKQKLKLAQRLKLKMDLPHEVTDTFEDEELFDIKRLTWDLPGRISKGIPRSPEVDDDNSEVQSAANPDRNEGPIIVDLLPNPRDKDEIKVEQWFDRPSFKYIDEKVPSFRENNDKPAKKIAETPPLTHKRAKLSTATAEFESSPVIERNGAVQGSQGVGDDEEMREDLEEETVPEAYETSDSEGGDADPQLETVEELALASYMVQSKKKTNEVVDWSYHRYTFGDKADNLPDWFVTDERKHYFKRLPEPVLDPETLAEHRARLRAIDARPIKKVIEARARKKGRLVRRLSRALQRAEKMSSAAGLNDQPGAGPDALKQRIIAKYSRNQANTAKRDKVYVVAKGRKSVSRAPTDRKGKKPAKNVKVKRVDRRMKKDNRAARTEKKKGRKGAKRGTSFGKRRR